MDEGFLFRANAKKNEYLLKTEELFVANKNIWLADFASHIQSVCAKILKLQNEAKLSAISYMDYTMLYVNFVNRRYIAEVWVYGDEPQLSNNHRMVGEYDIAFLFVYFDELWDKMLAERKRYVGKVKAWEVKSLMMQVLPDFYSYLISVARLAVAECADKSPFADIGKNEEFAVNVGNYLVSTEPVHTEKKTKDEAVLARQFEEQLLDEYIFGDYSGLDFSGKAYPHTDFRYANFRCSFLDNALFQGSTLVGANFQKAHMEHCCFDNCYIHEADFSYSKLKNASFVNAVGESGVPNSEVWHHVGFLPVSFRHADLTGADFRRANLVGADFTDAILDSADFTGAILDNAIFDGPLEKSKPYCQSDKNARALPCKNAQAMSVSDCDEIIRCYVMEPLDEKPLPQVPRGESGGIVKFSNLDNINEVDYDTRGRLISDRLKLLLERYMPEYVFKAPVVYLDMEKQEQAVFWRFNPPIFEGCTAIYRNDGVVSQVSFPESNAPLVFTTISPKGVRSIVVRLAVVESALLRGIFGLKFTKVSGESPR